MQCVCVGMGECGLWCTVLSCVSKTGLDHLYVTKPRQTSQTFHISVAVQQKPECSSDWEEEPPCSHKAKQSSLLCAWNNVTCAACLVSVIE